MRLYKYMTKVTAVCFLCLVFFSCQDKINSTQSIETSFAIVVDQETYKNTETSLLAYKQMLIDEGLHVVILKDEWKNADDIRTELKSLYNADPKLEGAVFIGDVPIPFIMNAQHLTTAYKRNQSRFPLHIAAIPSDRFYDDFDLEFDFIEKDSIRTNNYYYSLSANSPQYVSSDIYTGRIKPSVKEGDNKYELIEKYLQKVVALRNTTELDFLLSFTGHGYNGQDINAWAGEKIALREQFPNLYTTNGKVEFLDFRMAEFMKIALLNRLQDPELDIALMHEHGGDDIQLISGTKEVSNVPESIKNIKIYLRSKLRAAKRRDKSLEATKNRYAKNLGVPKAWFDGTFSQEMEEKDSIYNHNLDIYLDDICKIKPEAKFLMFDACFNGSFHMDRYIAGEYVFGNGSTIIAHGNTVNAIQDKWPDEMLGLLGLGVRAGNWAKQINTMETHLIGDPTYYFKSNQEINYNKVIAAGKENKDIWLDLLNVENPDLQCLAISNLFDAKNKNFASQLKEIYMTSNYFVVRMECLKQLNKYNNEDFKDVLKIAVNDPYELIRRLAVTMIGKTGDNEMIKPLLNSIFNDRYSQRVRSNAYSSLDFMDPDETEIQLSEIALQYSYKSNASELKDRLLKNLDRMKNKMHGELEYCTEENSLLKYKMQNVSILRNYHYHYLVPEYLNLLDNSDIDDSLKIAIIEAFGWYVNSVNNELIVNKCKEIASSENFSEEIRNEALRTVNRLEVYK
ncbi:MAG: HEAT repeat domain-containing protein [Bacteroidales bacterium]|nr:HEAT repeat domain-containing protein [Bacteroidales bacterium]